MPDHTCRSHGTSRPAAGTATRWRVLHAPTRMHAWWGARTCDACSVYSSVIRPSCSPEPGCLAAAAADCSAGAADSASPPVPVLPALAACSCPHSPDPAAGKDHVAGCPTAAQCATRTLEKVGKQTMRGRGRRSQVESLQSCWRRHRVLGPCNSTRIQRSSRHHILMAAHSIVPVLAHYMPKHSG